MEDVSSRDPGQIFILFTGEIARVIRTPTLPLHSICDYRKVAANETNNSDPING